MRATSKVPVQIYMDERQHCALKMIARESGTSVAALVRESIERYLDSLPVEKDPAMRIVALGGKGPRDLAEKHDEYLARIHSEQSRR